jgi:Asp-tRNA(Asn)/Glu-tRNA(Gln) amidotransferase A subunit family amidase
MTTSTGASVSIDSLVDLARALRSGELAAADYIQQIKARFAQREPELQSFVDDSQRWDRYHEQLEGLAERYPDPETRPPLFGIPFGVKDIFHVDGFPTGAGSKLPAEDLAGPQSAAVSNLLEAGAIVLGKTVTTEFAYFSPGPTRNPLDARRTPGGSSSGSAAAVGAGLCPLAFGTQTIGSIGRPASYCGVVGFKPSFGRISADGVIPLAPSLDHIGFFTRDVPSADLAAGLLCRQWRTEGHSAGRPVLGIPSNSYLGNASMETLQGFRSTVDALAAAGYEVRSVPALADFEEIDFRHRLLTAAEAARVHATWYARYSDRYAPKTVELIERGLPVTDEERGKLHAGRDRLRRELEDEMNRNAIDLWISPAAPGPAPLGIDSTGDPVMNLPWTHAGVPTLSLPGWTIEGLPVGLQLAARFGDDERLLAWAIDIEEALDS